MLKIEKSWGKQN